MSDGRVRTAAWLLVLCAGCSDGAHEATAEHAPDNGRSSAGIFWHTFRDLLGGEPDTEALAPSTRFHGAGIRFDHPALLRRSHERDEDGGQRFLFEHGMFELKLMASPRPFSGADYLGMLGYLFDGRTMQAGPVEAGHTAILCGHPITASRLQLRILGDLSEQQAFDLPAPSGESRVLVFDDEWVDDRPSSVGAETWKRVLDSLHCDPSFVLSTDAKEATAKGIRGDDGNEVKHGPDAPSRKFDAAHDAD